MFGILVASATLYFLYIYWELCDDLGSFDLCAGYRYRKHPRERNNFVFDNSRIQVEDLARKINLSPRWLRILSVLLLLIHCHSHYLCL